jgi:hypothetical protein
MNAHTDLKTPLIDAFTLILDSLDGMIKRLDLLCDYGI